MLTFLLDSFITALPVSVVLTSTEDRIVSESKICWVHFLAQFSTDQNEMWCGVFMFQFEHQDTTSEWWDKEKRNIQIHFLTELSYGCKLDHETCQATTSVSPALSTRYFRYPVVQQSLKHEGTFASQGAKHTCTANTDSAKMVCTSGVHAGQQATKSALLQWAYRGLSTKIHKQFAGEQKLMRAKDRAAKW